MSEKGKSSEKINLILATAMKTIGGLLKEDKRVIVYKPIYKRITGSVLSAMFLQQVIYWWYTNDEKPFYKFNDSCTHPAYKTGDSWIEELEFSRSEFEGARNKIATKIKKGVSKSNALKCITEDVQLQDVKLQDVSHLVIYWTDAEGVTYYQLNAKLLQAHMIKVYGLTSLSDAEIVKCLEDAENLHSLEIQDSSIPFNTKSTTETTRQRNNTSSASAVEDSFSNHNTGAKKEGSGQSVPSDTQKSPILNMSPEKIHQVPPVTLSDTSNQPVQPASKKREELAQWLKAVLRQLGREGEFKGVETLDNGFYAKERSQAKQLRDKAEAFMELHHGVTVTPQVIDAMLGQKKDGWLFSFKKFRREKTSVPAVINYFGDYMASAIAKQQEAAKKQAVYANMTFIDPYADMDKPDELAEAMAQIKATEAQRVAKQIEPRDLLKNLYQDSQN